jgi:FAD:protein FMN transferase
MYRFCHAAMATQFEVRCTHPDGNYARQAASAGFALVDRLEHVLSRFVENSDVSRINHLLPGDATVVSYETMQCLQLASLARAETHGAFDPSIGTGFDRLELFPAEFVVRARTDALLSHASPEDERGVFLDLGALGKGYAVDRLADVLEDWEVTEALIDAGASSVLALEPPAGEEGWPLILSVPGRQGGQVFARLTARQQALGASGIEKGDHIWNPREPGPVRTRRGAWLSAPRRVLADIGAGAGVEASAAAMADALSTALMINRADEVDAYCRRHPPLEVWILDDELRHLGAKA